VPRLLPPLEACDLDFSSPPNQHRCAAPSYSPVIYSVSAFVTFFFLSRLNSVVSLISRKKPNVLSLVTTAASVCSRDKPWEQPVSSIILLLVSEGNKVFSSNLSEFKKNVQPLSSRSLLIPLSSRESRSVFASKAAGGSPRFIPEMGRHLRRKILASPPEILRHAVYAFPRPFSLLARACPLTDPAYLNGKILHHPFFFRFRNNNMRPSPAIFSLSGHRRQFA